MHSNDLFAVYSALPRAPKLAPQLYANRYKAWLVVLWTFLGCLLIGVPFSFVRFRSSRPWEPTDMLLAGLAVAIFAVPIAGAFVYVSSSYTRLFQTGRLVQARVVARRPGGSVLQVDVGVGPDLTYAYGFHAEIGHIFPAIVGDIRNALVLVIANPGVIHSGSLLTAAQLSPEVGH